MGNLAVLYTDDMFSEDYHLMLTIGWKREVYRYALKATRKLDPQTYIGLLDLCKRYDVNRVWVHPDCQFSIWVDRTDFQRLPASIEAFVPKDEGIGIHPTGVRLQRKGEPSVYIFFPQYMRLTRRHSKMSVEPDWSIPSQDHLYNTVSYLGQAGHTPFMWSAATSSKNLLTRIHEQNSIEVLPFQAGDTWKHAHKNMIARPLWSVRGRDGKQGLADYMKQFKYVHGLDKNMQYLGACTSLKLPKYGYIEVPGAVFDGKLQGFWEYELLDVSGSMFNSYDCYCPFKIRDSWASTELIRLAIQSGIKLEVKQGLAYPDENMYKPYVLREWANTIWGGRKALQNERAFPDRIAASNAMDTLKLFYIDMIGQFNNEYSGVYFHPDWNMFIIHQAIANQAWSLLKRHDTLKGKIVLVANDAFYLLSNEQDIQLAYPDLVEYSNELRGYKHIGVAPLNDEIIAAFESRRPLDIEATIKRSMIHA